ncbi:nitroreductase family protein [Euzebya sp.]|uniref:nitroreductase family protein n=1 Tax=Euzebya sp. TaxID=1971409 RepID=UPI0035199083
MDFSEVVSRRRMVRSYRPDPVADEVVDRILDTARRAPSAGFAQPHRFVVVTDAAARRRVADACGEPAALARGLAPWLSVAPVHVVPCVAIADYEARYAAPDKEASRGPSGWDVPYWWVDGGAALMMLLLATIDEGLAAGFLDVPAADLRRAADVPDHWTPLGLVTIGHAADDTAVGSARRRPRRSLDEVVHRPDR